MNKKYFFAILLALSSVIAQSQIVTIPDSNFKNALVNTNCVDSNNDGVPDSDADINGDGEIQLSEAVLVDNLYVLNDNISDMTGIESFVNIIELYCHNNQISTLNLSTLTALEYLDCYNNNLTSLTVSNSPNLLSLRCDQNQLTSLDVTQNPDLEVLVCTFNNLLNLDISFNANLEVLSCSENELSSLDVTQNTNLDNLRAEFNQLTSLDVTQNTVLTRLRISGNQINTIDLSQNANLEIFYGFSGSLQSLDFSQNPNMSLIEVFGNNISSLNVINALDLESLNCSDNNLTSIDVSTNGQLQALGVYGNSLTELDLSQNSILNTVWCWDNELESLNIKNGNNMNMTRMLTYNNPNLFCIQVDDETATYPECNIGSNSGWCKDETAQYSEVCILGVTDNSLFDFILYPNPVNNIVRVKSSKIIDNLKIYSLQGTLLMETGSVQSLDVSRLNKGLYLVQISSKGSIFTQKIIKN